MSDELGTIEILGKNAVSEQLQHVQVSGYEALNKTEAAVRVGEQRCVPKI